MTSGIKSSLKVEKGLKKLFIFAAILLGAELTWLFVISPFIPFSTVEVQGFAELPRYEILNLAGINEASSFMSTNVKTAQERLSANILVESAKVIKRFPDKLSIFLVPRQAVAVTLGQKEGYGQKLLYLDKNGVIFKTVDSLLQAGNLPVLSGLENPQLNMRLPSALTPLVENICEIAVTSPELLASISEIRIERKAWDGYDLVLYPVHSGIKVRLENNLTEDVIRYVLLMLNIFEKSSPKPEEIDFRSGMGSYKLQEKSLW
jgi:cell division protein FtsQ